MRNLSRAQNLAVVKGWQHVTLKSTDCSVIGSVLRWLKISKGRCRDMWRGWPGAPLSRWWESAAQSVLLCEVR